MKIGIATSIYAKNSFDPYRTLTFVKNNDLSLVQLYMNDDLQNQTTEIATLREICEKDHISVICHSPYLIGSVAKEKEHCVALKAIFPKDSPCKVVIHFDEFAPLSQCLNDIEKLLKQDILPCIENFYQEKNEHGLISNTRQYISLFESAQKEGFTIIPVLDFPRLFITEFSSCNPLSITKEIIKSFAYQNSIIHAIDSLHEDQARENWCPLGEGIIPYKKIIEYLKKYQLSIESIILEYESPDLARESIEPARKLFFL